ncbi:MAG TPA: DUF3050 domain-containing protein [Rhodanobacteraceae bacterium]|jgi:hypothetical protein|nr:DUF3050 domain-containing protein [Rhodanobacteraceae bacterium]
MSAVIKTIKKRRDLAVLIELRKQLEQHPVFESLANIADLRRFMRAHVFAVWDFMSLLKRLQRDLTCVDVPWIPRHDKVAVHLINEIVLGEESDIAPNGEPTSHLDLYLAAMAEVGADTTQFKHFLALIASGIDPVDAMRAAGVPEHVRSFVAHTLRTAAHASTLTVMASFFHGRENVIPQMFTALLQRWHIAEVGAPMFVFYLKRHIEVDGETHGPMAQQIIERATGGDSGNQDLVMHAAIESVRARIALWDGVRLSLLEAEAA